METMQERKRNAKEDDKYDSDDDRDDMSPTQAEIAALRKRRPNTSALSNMPTFSEKQKEKIIMKNLLLNRPRLVESAPTRKRGKGSLLCMYYFLWQCQLQPHVPHSSRNTTFKTQIKWPCSGSPLGPRRLYLMQMLSAVDYRKMTTPSLQRSTAGLALTQMALARLEIFHTKNTQVTRDLSLF